MIDRGRKNLLGVVIDAVDYDAAVDRIVAASIDRQPFGVSALAVHGVMEGVADPELRHRINALDLVTADGQAVRWALNWLHATALPDRCYGPTLMLRLCEAAASQRIPVYLYGSLESTVVALAANLTKRFPELPIAGTSPSVFARVSPADLDAIATKIVESGAKIVFVGLGCPRQEVFAYEMRQRVSMPVVAVGAAFDYHGGVLTEPPTIVQGMGLQWLWRLLSEPRRLWRRYYRTNPPFLGRVVLQRLGRVADLGDTRPPSSELGHA